MNKILKHILTLLSFFIILNGYAQNENWGEEGDIENAQIIVEKNRKIELPIATRKFEKITVSTQQEAPVKQQYKLKSASMTLGALNPRLKVLKLKAEKPKKLLGNYAEIGFGNYVTPYLGIYLNSTEQKEYAYGINLNHISSKNGPQKYAGMSNSEIGLNGDYFLKNSTLSASIDYTREGYSYYGFDADKFAGLNEDSIRQILNFINTKISAKGTLNNLTYSVAGILNYLSAKKGISDLNTGYNADLEYELADKSSLLLNSDLMIESISAYDAESLSRVYFSLNPRYKFLHEGINITAGLNTVYDNDTINSAGGFHIYPHIFVNYPLFVNELNVFAGLTGGIERNSLTSLLQENRFYLPDTSYSIFNNNNTIEFFGGIKGNFNQRLGYKTQISYKNYKNLHFFINNPKDSTSFSIITDDGNTSLFSLTGELNYEISKQLTSSLNFEFNTFGLSKLDAAYFRPKFILGINAGYNIQDKLMLKSQLNYVQGLKGYNVTDGKIVNLKDIIDLNIEIDYKISNNFSSFVMLNNLISTEYQYYLNYPNKGFNVILGISYSF